MPSSRRTPRRRLVRPSTVVGALFLLAVGLVLLAIPFLKAPGHAQGARTDLEAARTSLAAGDIASADASVQSARRHADQVQDAMQGIGGDLWSLVPVLGAPVEDVRHLGNALDRLTGAAEVALDVWPSVSGDDATLFGDGSVDIETLDALVSAVDQVSTDLDAAQLELGEVRDSSIGVGSRLGEARDEAVEVVTPLAASARRAKPLTEVLPELFGGEGRRTYLLALLNPSEQRFSGGAPLTVVPMDVEGGVLSMGDAIDTTDPRLFKVGRWTKVEGNPFHNGKLRISTATFAPDWSVSGEEVLRGWERRTDQPVDGLVAVDVVALADMLRITGPVEAPAPYGTLDAGNFAEKLIGDYDTYPDNEARKDLNRAIVPVFAERLMTPGDAIEKIESLRTSAQGRHVALWMRDPDLQAAVAEVGLAGNLSDTTHDYVAVFNQNTIESKADYWQERTVSTDVRLAEDGSAKVRMTISVRNASPPYVQPFPDPREGYVTKWNGMTLGVFLPDGAELTRAAAAGRPQGTRAFDYYGRPYKLLRLVLPPGETREAVLEYDVPGAADAPGDGTLTYRLAATPQGLVVPQALDVTVHWPEGYDVGELPEGWTRTGPGVATYADPGLVTQPSFSVTGSTSPAAAP